MKGLISTLLLVGGLILLLVNPPLFVAAHTVGAILLAVWGVSFIFGLVVFAIGAAAINRAHKRHRSLSD